MKNPLSLAALALAALLSLMLASCRESDIEGDQYIDWDLSPALAEYDSVSIRLVATGDTNLLYEDVWHAKLPDPVNFPKHRLGNARGKDFTIRIRAFSAKRELLLAKDIKVQGKTAQPADIGQGDLRLFAFKPGAGTLKPAFDPYVTSYTLELPEAAETLVFQVTPMDKSNSLALNGNPQPWGELPSQALGMGDNLFRFAITGKGGKGGKERSYRLVAIRGEASKIDENLQVDKLEISPRTLRIFKGDPPASLSFTVAPANTPTKWSSLAPTKFSVDAFGDVSVLDSGAGFILIRGGNKRDSVPVEAIIDAPRLSVGTNLAIKKGAIVEFPIKVEQEHGTIAAFKYDLEGDGTWDNADSSAVPEKLTHAYGTVKSYSANFYVRDSEGNETPVTRTINVTDQALLVSIVWPGRDTVVNKSPIVVRYTVDGGPELAQEFALKEGPENKLTVEVGSGSEKGSASRNVGLDTQAPVVAISSPKQGDVIRGNSVAVAWSVDGNPQSDKATEDLGTTDGGKDIVRSFQDSAGNIGRDTVRVFRDVTPPQKPKLLGASPTNVMPKWTWSSGGGGSGFYRFQKSVATFPANAPETRDTAYALDAAVSGSKYSLYVQERDAAGNWSESAGLEIHYDSSRTVVNIVSPQASGTWVTRDAKVTLSGTTTGHYPVASMTLKVNGSPTGAVTFKNGAWSAADIAVAEGKATELTIGFIDSAGGNGEAALIVLRDTTAPGAPAFTASPATPTLTGKGSWSWSAGSDAAAGSGLNGKYRYALNGGSWTEGSAATVQDLVLKEGANAFEVQEQDNAGNWSASAKSDVVVDRVAPDIAITSHTGPLALNTTKLKVSGTMADAGSGIQSVTIAGQLSGSGTATLAAGTWASADLVLKSGANTLVATATDKVGNSTNASLVVNVSVADPVLVITYPAAGTWINKDTITVKYKVDGGAETGKLFTGLVAGANKLTVTSAPNDLGKTDVDSVTVNLDVTVPKAPSIAAQRANTRFDPVWTLTSNGDAAGGGGMQTPPVFQVSVDGAGPVTVNSGTYTIVGAAEKAYSVVVREQDKAGNWSVTSAAVVITVDKTGPGVTITSHPPVFITNRDSAIVTWTETGSLSSGNRVKYYYTFQDNGVPNTVSVVSDSDQAGNKTTKTFTLYRRSNVLFVNAAGTALPADGSTWANGYRNVSAAMSPWDKQVWVAAGTYTVDSMGLNPGSRDSLYGGFDPATAKALADRVPFNEASKTTLRNPNAHVLMSYGGVSTPITDVVIDGFNIVNVDDYGTAASLISVQNFKFINCAFSGATTTGTASYAVSGSNSSISFTGCRFSDFVTGSGYALSFGQTAGTQTITFSACEFTNPLTTYADHLLEATVTTFSVVNSKFLGTLRNGNKHIHQRHTGGAFTATGNTFKAADQAAAINTAGTSNTISGNTYTP